MSPMSDSKQYRNVGFRTLPIDNTYINGSFLTYDIQPNPDNFFSVRLQEEIQVKMNIPASLGM
jgi:hypothetical protein